MPKLPANFNWKESVFHIQLLEEFSKPSNISRVLKRDFMQEILGEKIEDAIERFVRDGALVPANLEESLDTILLATHVKKMLQERGLRISGSKAVLIDRLIDGDRNSAEKIAKQHRILKCSETALALLEKRKGEKAEEFENARNQSFELLKGGNAKEAYKVYAKYQKKYLYGFEARSFDVEEIQSVLLSCPLVLGNLTTENQKWLQAAAGMKMLWRDYKAEYWLPENFVTAVGDNRRAISYLIRNAYFQRIVAGRDRYYTKKAKITFREGDIESCQLCLSLNGKIFDLEEFPELPMVGCTSETGCMCDLDLYSSDDNDDFLEDEEDEIQIADNEIDTDPVNSLKVLKQLLDEDLITQTEYDEKKKEILSRL